MQPAKLISKRDVSSGSTTRLGSPTASTPSATAYTISALASIPVFAASTPMSDATASIWARTSDGDTVSNPDTPSVFCTVTAVTATSECTPT